MAEERTKLSDQIRQAVDESVLSRYAICKAAGIDEGTFSRFMSRRSGLSMATLDVLADVLRLHVVARESTAPTAEATKMTDVQTTGLFESYPHAGRTPVGRLRGGTCRRGYGLKLQQRTGQTRCAYCDLNLVDCYEHWLLMTVDHVVPIAAGKELNIPEDWLYDMANTVLCCSGCNGFRNTWKLTLDGCPPNNFAEFADLRKRVFAVRREGILAAHRAEQRFFQGKPWEDRREDR